MTTEKNIIVVGASYVGRRVAMELAKVAGPSYRVLVVEAHDQFHHLFAFPRWSVISGHERKAFIPFTHFPESMGDRALINARVDAVHPSHIKLDRPAYNGSNQVPFSYLVIATGTRLVPPSNMPGNDKESSVAYLRSHQQHVQRAKSVLVVGGGAVGVQIATDIKAYFPEKQVTMVHSRDRVMQTFHQKAHDTVKRRFDELGVRLITGARAVTPPSGFPKDGKPFDVFLTNGGTITTEFVISATGQKANSELISSLPHSSPSESHVNPSNGCIRITPTMQLQDSKYPNIFVAGDIADTGGQKSVFAALDQVTAITNNVQALIKDEKPAATIAPFHPGIHISIGGKLSVTFHSPHPERPNPEVEPEITYYHDGQDDMNIGFMWERLGFKPEDAQNA